MAESKRQKLAGANDSVAQGDNDPFEEEGRKQFGAAYSPSLFRKNTGFFSNSSSFGKFPNSLGQYCLTPLAKEQGQSIFKPGSWRPLTEDEKRERGFHNHTDTLTEAKNRELIRKFFMKPSPASTATRVTQQEKKLEQSSVTQQERKLEQSETPYCNCDPQSSRDNASKLLVSSLPEGALEEHRQQFVPIWIEYKRQIRQSNYFDIDVHPGPSFAASVLPVEPFHDFNGKGGLFKELANCALEEYSKKDKNTDKYEVKKIEKVVFAMLGTSKNYWMTVRVLNLNLATAIETFQIHARLQFTGEKTIMCCRLKEEAVVGLASCDVCFGKLPKSDVTKGKKA